MHRWKTAPSSMSPAGGFLSYWLIFQELLPSSVEVDSVDALSMGDPSLPLDISVCLLLARRFCDVLGDFSSLQDLPASSTKRTDPMGPNTIHSWRPYAWKD